MKRPLVVGPVVSGSRPRPGIGRARRKLAWRGIATVLLALLTVPAASAQPLSLPNLDGISVFYRLGTLSGSSPLEANPTSSCVSKAGDFPLCGWGVETFYDLLGDDKEGPWGAELAVGYDFMALNATPRRDSRYEILGSIQSFPSFAIYLSRDFSPAAALYLGVGSGWVKLNNVRAYDADGNSIEISGDTWNLTASVGFAHQTFEKKNGLSGNLFGELAYEFRDFPSLAYSLPTKVPVLPDALPRSLSARGVTVNLGYQLKFGKDPKRKPSPQAECPRHAHSPACDGRARTGGTVP